MPNLKDIKNRITSVQNTKKITKAMKMVAAAKVKKAESPNNYKRFIKMVCDAKTGREITQKEEDWVVKILSKINKDDFAKKEGQRPYQQVETWLREGKFIAEDIMKDF